MKKYILAESEFEIKISGTNPQVQFWRDSAKWRIRLIPKSGINVSCWEALSDEMLIRPFPKLISSFSEKPQFNFQSSCWIFKILKSSAQLLEFDAIVVIAHNRELSCSWIQMLRCRCGRASSSVFYKTKEKQEENWLPDEPFY